MKRVASLVILFFSCIPLTAKTCIFCTSEIIENQSVLECQFFNVLLDYMPRAPGHLLVIPKRHVVKAHELSKDEWAELGNIIPKITKVFSEFLEADDYIILEKNGPNAFQHVPHVHFHLLPVHSETWSSIFDIIPDKLTQEALEKQVKSFRGYFNAGK
jgi:histidine triad (HIT) family protein